MIPSYPPTVHDPLETPKDLYTKAAFPERAGATMTSIECHDVALVEQPHRRGEVACPRQANQQVNMIAHQCVRVNTYVTGRNCLRQQFAVEMVILPVDKDGGPIHAALRDVKRDAGNDQTRATGHATVLLIV